MVATSPLWGEAHVYQNLPKLVADLCLHPDHHTASAHLVVVGQYDSCACACTVRVSLHPIYVIDLRQSSIMLQHVVLFCPIGQVCCVCCMHGKLCCTNHGVPHPDPLIFLCAGAEQAGVCQHAVSLAAHQQPHWQGGQAGKATPAAQQVGICSDGCRGCWCGCGQPAPPWHVAVV